MHVGPSQLNPNTVNMPNLSITKENIRDADAEGAIGAGAGATDGVGPSSPESPSESEPYCTSDIGTEMDKRGAF